MTEAQSAGHSRDKGQLKTQRLFTASNAMPYQVGCGDQEMPVQ